MVDATISISMLQKRIINNCKTVIRVRKGRSRGMRSSSSGSKIIPGSVVVVIYVHVQLAIIIMSVSHNDAFPFVQKQIPGVKITIHELSESSTDVSSFLFYKQAESFCIMHARHGKLQEKSKTLDLTNAPDTDCQCQTSRAINYQSLL